MRTRDIIFYLVVVMVGGFLSCSKDDPADPIPFNAPDSVVFNEIYSTGDPDWIELYNYGNGDVDLSGWRVFDQEDNAYSLPAGTNLKSKDYLILYCDDQGSGLNLPFKLSSQGEAITLQRQDGKTMDRVAFPPMDDGQSYARFPDGMGSWQLTGFATQNMTNGEGPVSFFKSYSYAPDIPMVGDDIVFSLTIGNEGDVARIELVYNVDNGATQTIDMSSTDNLTYTASVPGLSVDGELYYYFKLVEGAGKEIFLPYDALEDPYDMTITSGEVPNLLINEIMASNLATLADPDGIDEFDDWIEIYNAGPSAVDLGRFYFSDSEDRFDDRIPGDAPDKTTIQPGGHLLFWADSDTEQGANHLKFRLSASGETISLYYKDGRLIDSHSFGIQTTDVSEGRSTDGASNWIKFNLPTPGSANK